MPDIIYTFANPINVSLQAKPTGVATGAEGGAYDNVYFTRISAGKQLGSVKLIGSCILTDRSTNKVTVNAGANIPLPEVGDYLFFAKNSNINTPGLMGYYAEVEMTNDSTQHAELFAVSSDVSESSK